MSKKMKRILMIFFSIVLIISIIAGIILTTQLLYRFNHRTTDEILAEKNEVKIGEETVFYVDLTQNKDTQEPMNQLTENNQENNQENNPTENDKNENTEKIETEQIEAKTNVFQQINQDYFDMEFDLNAGKAIVDGDEIDIADLLDITQEEKNELLSSTDEFYNYLNDNMIGDLAYEDGNIKVENPYSTNAIMIKTSNLTEIENGGDIQSIVKVANEIYCVHYDNAEDTKEGYNILKDDEFVSNISTDTKIKTLDHMEEESVTFETEEIEALGVSNNNYAWGVDSTGLKRYLNKLNYGENETEIKVAVFDSGVRTTHEIFTNETTSDRLDTTYSYNFVDDNTDISDDNGHGTMVAGIIAQSTSNNVKIVPVKILDSEGNGVLSDALEGLVQIVNYVDVINLSLGVSESEIEGDTITIADGVLEQIYDDGKVIVCASGNDGEEDVYYPASSPYTIAVSAVDTENHIASFSNYGDTIDFAAPGQGLVLPYYTGDNLYNVDFETTTEEYRTNSGTSFAAPFVAAAASLIKAENDTYTVEEVEQILIDNSEDLGDSGKDKYYGYGSINFDSNMFAKPVVASVDITEEWGAENIIEVYAVCGNEIENWAYTYSQEPPTDSDWRAFDNPSTIVSVKLTVPENRDYYIWFKDAAGNKISQVVTTNRVDREKPVITNQLTATPNTSASFTANLSVQDNQSGLAKIVWYCKKITDSNYMLVTDTYATEGTGETKEVTKAHQFANLQENTTYQVYAEVYDIVGNFVKTNEISVTTLSEDENPSTNTTPEENQTEDTNTIPEENQTEDTNTMPEENQTEDTNTTPEENQTEDTNATPEENQTEDTNTMPEENQTENVNTIKEEENNTYVGESNSNDNNAQFNRVPAKVDNSTASKKLPKTGNHKLIMIVLIVLCIAGIFAYIKYRKLKEIK